MLLLIKKMSTLNDDVVGLIAEYRATISAGTDDYNGFVDLVRNLFKADPEWKRKIIVRSLRPLCRHLFPMAGDNHRIPKNDLLLQVEDLLFADGESKGAQDDSDGADEVDKIVDDTPTTNPSMLRQTDATLPPNSNRIVAPDFMPPVDRLNTVEETVASLGNQMAELLKLMKSNSTPSSNHSSEPGAADQKPQEDVLDFIRTRRQQIKRAGGRGTKLQDLEFGEQLEDQTGHEADDLYQGALGFGPQARDERRLGPPARLANNRGMVRLQLQEEDCIAGEFYYDLINTYGTVSAWARHKRWATARNGQEALTLARAVDMAVGQGLSVCKWAFMEVLMRRICALQLAEENRNNWSIASEVEEPGCTFGAQVPERAKKRALKKATLRSKLRKTQNKDSDE